MFLFLQIYDGPIVDEQTLLGKFCGSGNPGTFNSTGNLFYIFFHTDGSNSGDGFIGSYRQIGEFC